MNTKTTAGAAANGRRVQLPPLVAAWVLGAHVYALLVPLILLFVVQQQSELVAARADYPGMFSLTVLLMMVGSTFEITQNHLDRWYLTPETASANGHSTLDMLFFSFVVLSQAAVIVACRAWWSGGVAWGVGGAVPVRALLECAPPGAVAPYLGSCGLVGGLLWRTRVSALRGPRAVRGVPCLRSSCRVRILRPPTALARSCRGTCGPVGSGVR